MESVESAVDRMRTNHAEVICHMQDKVFSWLLIVQELNPDPLRRYKRQVRLTDPETDVTPESHTSY